MNIAIVSFLQGVRRHQILRTSHELGRDHHVTVYARRQREGGRARARVAPGVVLELLDVGPNRPLQNEEITPYLSRLGDALARRWARERPDLVHACSWAAGLAAASASAGLRVPVTQSFATARLDGHLRLERALGRRAAAVIARCGDEESQLIRLGVPRRRIAVVPYGVDVERFRRQGPAAARGARPRLLYVGRLSTGGGAPTAIRALAGLPGAELVIAGGPPRAQLGHDADATRLRALAGRAGVADRVTLLGQVSGTAVPKLMRGADLIVSLPREAGSGSVALEAMACGVPVIASAVGSHLDSVVDGVTGLLVPPERPARTARLARELLTNPTRRTALGFAGADRARSRYSWARVGQELLRVYEGTLAVRALPRG